MKSIIAVIGAPGTGKSTVMKSWMQHWEWEYHRTGLLDHYTSGDLIVLGRYDEGETFGGTDRLAMNVMPEAIQFLQDTEEKIIILEGDRLNSSKFFNAALEAGYELNIINLIVLDNIREQRYADRGSDQDQKFINGRITKVKNIVEEFGPQQTLFGEELGYVTTLANNYQTDAEEIGDHIQEIINDNILDSVVGAP
jgi:ABC-type dipeptide/oligopeptide/nickel transport system ATPase component